MTAVKIKVLHRELYNDIAKTYGGQVIHQCELFREGQEFITGLSRPDDFCDWAWNDIYRSVVTLLTFGSFQKGLFNGWVKDENIAIACCTDGFRPVTFLLERIDTKSLLDISKIQNAAPFDVYSSERWGEFSYTLSNLGAGKNYLLRLHFVESFFYSAGKRIFSVEVNGKRVIENLDIFATAGGLQKVFIKEIPVMPDAKGKIIIDFIKGTVDNPKLSAIELFEGSGSNNKAMIAINSGGSAVGSFKADECFNGGNVFLS